jgi:arsenate-mycothiol transferase
VSIPRVLFVCVKNGGKSQMAAGLMRRYAGAKVDVDSAGTHPGPGLNPLSVRALQEAGVEIGDRSPQALTPPMVAAADLVVVLGDEAHVDPVAGTPVIVWRTDEPSRRGIDGIERMRLVRDDIDARVRALADELTRAG